jgi:hypothetical protein
MGRSIQAGQNFLSDQELRTISKQHIQSLLLTTEADESDIVVQQLKHNDRWMEAWEKEHEEIIQHLCTSKTVEEQKIALRKETLALIENCSITQPFLREGLTDEEVDLLLKHRHPDISIEDAKQAQFQTYIFSDASLRCLRRLSAEFSDAAEAGWYHLCLEIYRQHISHLYRHTIAQLTGDQYQFESLVEVMRNMIDEVEKKVLDGKPWDFSSKLQDIRQFEALQQSSNPDVA